jgi:hypothetical protein
MVFNFIFIFPILWCGQSDIVYKKKEPNLVTSQVRENSRMFLEWRTYCLNMATSTKFFFPQIVARLWSKIFLPKTFHIPYPIYHPWTLFFCSQNLAKESFKHHFSLSLSLSLSCLLCKSHKSNHNHSLQSLHKKSKGFASLLYY